MNTRYKDWPERLNDYFVSVRNKEFEYGVFDCCIFTAGAVEAITGEDHMEEFRDQYESKESSDKALEEIGNGTLYDTLAAKFGDPIPGSIGQRGDIAMFEGCCGIVTGPRAIFLIEEERRFGFVPISKLECVFKVGR